MKLPLWISAKNPLRSAILEYDPLWKDHDFSGHKGCVLEFAVELKHMELLEFVLREGADTGLELARIKGAGSEMLELI